VQAPARSCFGAARAIVDAALREALADLDDRGDD
jgi:hypothetical protein